MTYVVAVVKVSAIEKGSHRMGDIWEFGHGMGTHGDPLICLTSTGDVCEFQGWAKRMDYMGAVVVDGITKVAEMLVPIPGPTIATAEDLGGDDWREWLRSEGWL